jgi:hypothetical protein
MDERLAEASTASLCIVAVGLIPVILASRAITRPGESTAVGVQAPRALLPGTAQ